MKRLFAKLGISKNECFELIGFLYFIVNAFDAKTNFHGCITIGCSKLEQKQGLEHSHKTLQVLIIISIFDNWRMTNFVNKRFK